MISDATSVSLSLCWINLDSQTTANYARLRSRELIQEDSAWNAEPELVLRWKRKQRAKQCCTQEGSGSTANNNLNENPRKLLKTVERTRIRMTSQREIKLNPFLKWKDKSSLGEKVRRLPTKAPHWEKCKVLQE